MKISMKTEKIVGTIITICLVSFSFAWAGTDREPKKDLPGKPVAVVSEPGFDFGSVVDGKKVTHEYVIENKGDAPLAITSVKTSCGCATASYSKEIQPNSKGSVVIDANTRGYGGHHFSKSITVHTNDPEKKKIRMNISGKIERFARIEPKHVRLTGTLGEKIETSIKIIPGKNYPFNVIEAKVKDEKKIRCSLAKKENVYVLTVENLHNIKGKYYDMVTLKTDSTTKPEIRIRVFANITEPESAGSAG